MGEPTYTFCQSDLSKLDLQVDRGTDFSAWRTQWELYCSLSGLEKEDSQKQVKALMLCFARERITIVQNLGLNEAQRKDVTAIIEAMQRYVLVKWSNAVTFDAEYKCQESHLTISSYHFES